MILKKYGVRKEKKMKKSKTRNILKILTNILAIFLAIAIIVVGILFFPLMGKKHIEIWSPKQTFDIQKIQTLEKYETTIRYLCLPIHNFGQICQ